MRLLCSLCRRCNEIAQEPPKLSRIWGIVEYYRGERFSSIQRDIPTLLNRAGNIQTERLQPQGEAIAV